MDRNYKIDNWLILLSKKRACSFTKIILRIWLDIHRSMELQQTKILKKRRIQSLALLLVQIRSLRSLKMKISQNLRKSRLDWLSWKDYGSHYFKIYQILWLTKTIQNKTRQLITYSAFLKKPPSKIMKNSGVKYFPKCYTQC